MNDLEDLGPCCACGRRGDDVRNILMLPQKAPVPGAGWGCVRCELPFDGAVAVVCDGCLEAGDTVKEVCHGYPGEGRRMARSGLIKGVFKHNLTKHPEAGDYD